MTMPQPGPSTGEKVTCSKCNRQTICSVCTSGDQFSSQPGPTTGETVICSKCNRQMLIICMDCDYGHHLGSELELSKGEKNMYAM